MWVCSAASAVMWMGLSSAVASDDSPACREVREGIDRAILEVQDSQALQRLTPHMSAPAIGPLLGRATASRGDRMYGAYVALGLSRHAEALSRIRALPPSGDPERDLGRQLALLALGDGVGTGSIAAALKSGSLEVRRSTARALSVMQQKRPLILLYEALADPDEEVRLIAAEVHVRRRSRRARRVLLELLQTGSAAQRARAGYALLYRRHRFRADELSRLPEALRVQAVVAAAMRTRRPNTRLLRSQALSADPAIRASALAVLGVTGAESRAGFRRLWRRIRSRRGRQAAAQATMMLALLGDGSAINALSKFGAAEARQGHLVLWAFSAGGPPHNQLESDHALQLIRPIGKWAKRGLLKDEAQARTIQSIDAADPGAALTLARRRLSGDDGDALRAAVKVVGRLGQRADLKDIVALARRASGSTQVEAWRAASRICSR